MNCKKIIISDKFIGGNIVVTGNSDSTFFLKPDIRDSDNWFYWAFCVKGAGGQTLTFDFEGNNVIGYFGPSVSHDLKTFRWLNCKNSHSSFTYTFKENENEVYFSHDMLYHPHHFEEFLEKHSLTSRILCISEKGRSTPSLTFGHGDKSIVLTARHHACESTGNYVLEGVLDFLVSHPIEGYEVFCVPFVDYDGVIDGDQGKCRHPHDHYVDYLANGESIYSSVNAIQKYALSHNIEYAFDFHSPWHIGEINDKAFIVQESFDTLDNLNKFGEILEKCISVTSFKYEHADDFPPGVDWNIVGTPSFPTFMLAQSECNLSFPFEIAYFGTDNNVFTKESAFELGRCFANALCKYISAQKA